MKTELDDVRRRLNIAERDLVESKEECIQLTNTVQSLERDVCQINIFDCFFSVFVNFLASSVT